MAKVEGLKAQLKMINIEPRKVEDGLIGASTSFFAPIGGVVTQQNLVLGQFVEPQELALEIIDLEKLQLKLHIFEKNISKLEVGQELIFYVSDNPDAEFKAIITHIGRSIETDTKTILCTARIVSDERNNLVNGQYVETNIITSQREAFSLPAEAIFKAEDYDFVLSYVEEREGNMIFHKTPVELGDEQKEFVEILDKGLEDILIEGGYNLLPEE